MKLKELFIDKALSNKPCSYKDAESADIGDIKLFYNPSPENNGFYFTAINWVSNDADKEIWSDETDIEIVCDGWAAFDGIRHLYFGSEKTDNEGYFNYPNMEEMAQLISELIKLQNKYCRDFGGSND